MFLNCTRMNRLLIYRKYISNCKFLHCSSIQYLRKPTSTKKYIDSFPTSQESTVSGVFPLPEHLSDINTNFYGIESDEGVIHVDETSKSDKLIQDTMASIQQPKCEFRSVSFGAIRLDSENKPSCSARYSELEDNKTNQRELKRKLYSDNISRNTLLHTVKNQTETTAAIIREIDEKYKLENESHRPSKYVLNKSNFDSTEMRDSVSDSLNSEELPSNYINEFYFPEEIAKDSKLEDKNTNFIDEQHFISSELENIDQDKFIKNKDVLDHPDKFIKEKTVFNNSENDKKYSFAENIRNIVAKHEENSLDQVRASSKNNIIDIQDISKSENDFDNYIDKYYFNEEKDFIPQKEKINLNKEKQYYNTESYLLDKNDLSHKFNDNVLNNSNDNFKNHDVDFNVKSVPQENLDEFTKQFLLSSVEKKQAPNFIKNNTFNTYRVSQNKFVKNKFVFASHSDDTSNVIPNKLIQRKSDAEAKYQIHGQTKNLNKLQNAEDSKKNITSMSESLKPTFNKADEPDTAFDFVQKLREKEIMSDLVKKGISAKKEKKLDSKGFRILKHQVPSLMYFTRDEMLELLEASILYSDDDIVVLNKPYNLVMHESKTTKDNACLSNYLDDLAKLLDKSNTTPELFTVHRLDKETTGCLLLARNELAAQRLKSLFSQRKIMKTYWIVTSRIPDPLEGVIDIPISEGTIEKKSRMVLHPDLPKDLPYVNHSKCGKRAVTAYSVIATSGNAALVEVKPETGIKHQIRVHFGFGLECPILGDHKYSHLDKLAPQKLPSDLLQKLQVRQSKVRHIPLHIHSKHILIPQYSHERNFFVTAPLPKHMAENLRSLKFRKK